MCEAESWLLFIECLLLFIKSVCARPNLVCGLIYYIWGSLEYPFHSEIDKRKYRLYVIFLIKFSLELKDNFRSFYAKIIEFFEC